MSGVVKWVAGDSEAVSEENQGMSVIQKINQVYVPNGSWLLASLWLVVKSN
jgi:hypothetical protein